MTEDQLQQIKSLNWSLLYQKLEAFSLSLGKLYFKKRYRNLPKGYTYEDVVQRAIKLALDRDWTEIDPKVFEDYLFGAVKSIYWGLVISGDNRKTKPLSFEFNEDSEKETINGEVVAHDQSNINDMADDLDFSTTIELIEVEISEKQNSVELRMVFDCIREGLEPRQISDKTGLALGRVTNCKRQLLRIVDNISKTLNDAESQK